VKRVALTPNAWLRYEYIRNFLSELENPRSFLEIGCGQGALATHLVERFEYVGYEPDPESFQVAWARVGGRGKVHNEFLPEVPYRRFDLIGAFEVLEHVEEDEQALASWIRWLVPGGWLLLSVPAGPSRFGAGDRRVGHFRRYRRGQLQVLLERIGLEQVSILSYGFPLGYVLEEARNFLSVLHSGGSTQERTASSGRYLQPPEVLALFTRLCTAPFRIAQRPFRDTNLGTGIVAFARRPIDP
jgi:SAM-dependent methyltransferase